MFCDQLAEGVVANFAVSREHTPIAAIRIVVLIPCLLSFLGLQLPAETIIVADSFVGPGDGVYWYDYQGPPTSVNWFVDNSQGTRIADLTFPITEGHTGSWVFERGNPEIDFDALSQAVLEAGNFDGTFLFDRTLDYVENGPASSLPDCTPKYGCGAEVLAIQIDRAEFIENTDDYFAGAINGRFGVAFRGTKTLLYVIPEPASWLTAAIALTALAGTSARRSQRSRWLCSSVWSTSQTASQ